MSMRFIVKMFLSVLAVSWIFWSVSTQVVFAYQSLWTEFVSYDMYLQLRQKATTQEWRLSDSLIKKAKNAVSGKECSWHEFWWKLAISPLCLLQQKFPELWFNESVDAVWDDVLAFDTQYDLEREYFEYESATPVLSPELQQYAMYFDWSKANTLLLYALAYKDVMIYLPKKVIAVHNIPKFSWYVVRKDMSNQWPCGRQNFMLAYNSLNNLILEPGKVFNLNAHIAYNPNYCQFDWPNYMFNWGVCWVSTQLYRITLLHPDLAVRERHPHSKRWVQYYADYIYGDDAAMYEDIKNFKIENTWTDPILIKNLDRAEYNKKYNYLVAVSPKRLGKKVAVTKKQTWQLSSTVTKQIIDSRSNSILSSRSRDSTYGQKWYSLN